ncbi:hypothetical protein [Clostridium botulinum]|uniref:hypothetical protein n=1 Tax=Clostridium botulinum TaxID=1491 RepID=UPI001E573E95|nr:hypothetical protein [Clostridium botulinum]
MKVLTSGKQLEGKKIVYCGIEHMADIDGTMIITEDREVLMFNGRGGEYDMIYNIADEQQIIRCILSNSDTSIRRILLKYSVITEEEIKQMQKEVDKKNKERDKEIEEDEYKEYLKLKERFEGK